MKKYIDGYFYTYRGNGYGPFDSYQIAELKLLYKMLNDNSDIGKHLLSRYKKGKYQLKIYFGTVVVDNKELIEFTAKGV